MTHTPEVGDLWLAPGECLAWGPAASLPSGCSEAATDWYVGYVEQVFPDGSFVQSWGGGGAADSGLGVTWFSGAMDPFTSFIHLMPPGTLDPSSGPAGTKNEGGSHKSRVRRTPKLRIGRVNVRGHHVGFSVTLPKDAARGRLRVIARSARSARSLQVHGSKSVRRVSATLADAGLWRAQISFVPFDHKHWRRGRASVAFTIS